MTDEDIKAIRMLDKFVTEHKLFNIKQSEGLEDNISIILNLIEKQDKIINEMAKYIDDTQMEVGTYFKDKNDVIEYFEKKVGE